MDWTEETISRLRSLWQEGLSTAEIGRRMSITKNAVVGKAHRLTLPPRPSPIRKGLADAGSHQGALRTSRVAQFVPRPANQSSLDDAGTAGSENRPVAATVTALRMATPPTPEPKPELAQRQPSAAAMAQEARPASVQPAPRPANPSSPRRYGQSCCWPLGEPGTKQFHFCGSEPVPGKPYCGEHAQLAYVKLRDRRDTVA